METKEKEGSIWRKVIQAELEALYLVNHLVMNSCINILKGVKG